MPQTLVLYLYGIPEENYEMGRQGLHLSIIVLPSATDGNVILTPLPLAALPKQEEETMKNWLENYRPVR